MHRFLAIGSLIVVLGIVGCYYDTEENLYPSGNCNTSNISFSSDVLPILNNSCMVCHSAAANLGNITLEGHNDVLKYANDGSLVGSIKHLFGYSAMPQGASKMNACNIAKIESWVNAGSPNN